jgi:hypothetical protein
MDVLDFKKLDKQLYQPKPIPGIVVVPQMLFLAVEGKGDPNQPNGEYARAVELLYALSYTIKMSKMGSFSIPGYHDFVVAPLEGLWWFPDHAFLPSVAAKKSELIWRSLIRQPRFVTEAVLEQAKAIVRKKAPHLDVSKANLIAYTEGPSVQMMHIGVYDDEPASIAKMHEYMEANHLEEAIGKPSPDGWILSHHEIYLSDPRKANPKTMRTILRHPVFAPRP